LPGFIQQTLRNGQALILVDGFDELDPPAQKHVVDWFKALHQAYPKIRIVTTGCADQLNGLIGIGFNPLALIAWDPPKAANFIQQWGELWSRAVVGESPSPPGSDQVDSLLLNTWLSVENHGLTANAQSLGRLCW
jgi:hypothetical protein